MCAEASENGVHVRPVVRGIVRLGGVKRLMATFGKEAEWERLSGNFVIDAAKLRGIGWDPRVKTREGIAAMMRSPNGGAI